MLGKIEDPTLVWTGNDFKVDLHSGDSVLDVLERSEVTRFPKMQAS